MARRGGGGLMVWPLIVAGAATVAGAVGWVVKEVQDTKQAQQQTEQLRIEEQRQSALRSLDSNRITALSAGTGDDWVQLLRVLAVPLVLVGVGIFLLVGRGRR